MKKAIILGLVAVLAAGVLAGCGGGTSSASTVKMKDGQTVTTVVEKIVEDVGMQMPSALDDGIMEATFYIKPADDVEEYAGQMAMTMTSADHVVAVKAKPGKKQAVVDGLTKRLSDVQNSFAQYLPDQSAKAKKGQIIEKGDYVFLVIIGQDETTFDADMTKAKEIIDAAF